MKKKLTLTWTVLLATAGVGVVWVAGVSGGRAGRIGASTSAPAAATVAPAPRPSPPPQGEERLYRIARWYKAVFYALAVVMIAAFGLYILVRAGRRERESLFHTPPGPTPDSDVWRQHKLPPTEDHPETTETGDDP